MKSSASPSSAVIQTPNPPRILTQTEVTYTPSQTLPLPPDHVSVAPARVSAGVSMPQQAPLIWRYKDVDIELGNRFPYTADDTTDSVADFEVRGKVVKSFLGKDPMYNQNLNVKATVEDVSRIKAIVRAAPNSDGNKPSFEWPFDVTKEAVFKFVNKDNLKVDFAEIFDAAEMDDIYNVAERRRHSLGANEVRLGSRVMVEFTIAIWRKKPERSGCTFHLISVGLLERARDNALGGFQSPKKRQKMDR
jgi:hypothetical protein